MMIKNHSVSRMDPITRDAAAVDGNIHHVRNVTSFIRMFSTQVNDFLR
jgi:hypothetical protein